MWFVFPLKEEANVGNGNKLQEGDAIGWDIELHCIVQKERKENSEETVVPCVPPLLALALAWS